MRTQRYLLKKVLQALLTLAFILVFNFFLFRAIPGDPVTFLTRQQGQELSIEARNAIIRDYGLDEPMPQQFLVYIADTLTGNLGISSLFPGERVLDIFLHFTWPTLLLVGLSTILSTVGGLLLGIHSGWRRGGAFDLSSMGASLVLYSMPEFWLGMLLLLTFSGFLGWFPSGGYRSVTGSFTGIDHIADILNHLFLPCLTLALAFLGEYYLVMRSSLLDVLGEDYITTARAKGVRDKLVLRRHAVRNALLPTVTLIALNFGFVLGGAITVETVFSYPGLGLLTYDALESKDYWLLQGMFLFFSVAVIVANLIADLLYAYLDPRVREA